MKCPNCNNLLEEISSNEYRCSKCGYYSFANGSSDNFFKDFFKKKKNKNYLEKLFLYFLLSFLIPFIITVIVLIIAKTYDDELSIYYLFEFLTIPFIISLPSFIRLVKNAYSTSYKSLKIFCTCYIIIMIIMILFIHFL